MPSPDRDRDHADLLKYNRILIRALVRRDRLVAQLDSANRDLLDARRMVRALIDRLKQQPPPAGAQCDTCGDLAGSNPACFECQTIGPPGSRGGDASPEN